MKYTITKIKRRLWREIVTRMRKTALYPFLYKSFWHRLFGHQENPILDSNLYLAARPNPGAGIGHQMANWISGYWWARHYRLKFAHIPFSTLQWETFLGFGENEVTVTNLLQQGYKKVLIPLFDEDKESDLDLIRSIIASYNGQRVVFICEQDQFYRAQYGVMKDIKQKFYAASVRKKDDKIVYSKDHYNIAIHVRRGDITIGQKTKNPNLLIRWQDTDYFVNVLFNVLKHIKIDKPIAIYIFSQGEQKEISEFEQFDNVHYCLEMNPTDSFLHMVYADLLITSKSSFSYKPALLNNGIKVCPKDFWHGYPETEDWILADEKGYFEMN